MSSLYSKISIKPAIVVYLVAHILSFYTLSSVAQDSIYREYINRNRYERGMINNCDNKIYGVTIKGSLIIFEDTGLVNTPVEIRENAFPFPCNALVKSFNNRVYAVKAKERGKTRVYEYNPATNTGRYTKWELPSHDDTGWISGGTDSKGNIYFATTSMNTLVRIDLRKNEVNILWTDNSYIRKWNKNNCVYGCNFYINKYDEMLIKQNVGSKLWTVGLSGTPGIIKETKINSIVNFGITNDFFALNLDDGGVVEYLANKDRVVKLSEETVLLSSMIKIDTARYGILTDLAGCNNFMTHKRADLIKELPSQSAQPLLVDIKQGTSIRLENVIFKLGEANLLQSSYTELNRLVEWMKKENTKRILLEGHTDIEGTQEDNLQLSIDRVIACKQYLTAQGINATRIETRGYGGLKPIRTKGTAKEREVNRRVEVKLLN
jgi:outer membrane protein OmpA-like peptidoglycan-associated protein